MKTVSVALSLCLNIGIDPPDVVKTSPCARMECWMGKCYLCIVRCLVTVSKLQRPVNMGVATFFQRFEWQFKLIVNSWIIIHLACQI